MVEDNFNPFDFIEIQSFYESWKFNSLETINELNLSKKEFNGKSLPGRGVMLINSLGISSNFMPKVFEQDFSPKIGNYVPGTDIYIEKDKNIDGSNLIIWSWHIIDEIITYLKDSNVSASIWTPLPEFKKVADIN